MTDIVDRKTRSRMMSAISSRNSKPEIIVRRLLHGHGYRFRLHRKDLPGSPDIVMPGRKIAIFVHGCHWHRHEGCRLAYSVKSNVEFWNRKFEKNVERDRKATEALLEQEWRVITVWECATRNLELSVLGELVVASVESDQVCSEITGW